MEKIGEEVLQSRDARRVALEQVLQTQTFARSEQMRKFLRYVCEMEISGRGAEIKEYLIGVEVFKRPADYSPANDSSVRSRAWELRQKLEEIYTHELSDAPVRIVLPKGSYVPVFQEREVHPANEPEAEIP